MSVSAEARGQRPVKRAPAQPVPAGRMVSAEAAGQLERGFGDCDLCLQTPVSRSQPRSEGTGQPGLGGRGHRPSSSFLGGDSWRHLPSTERDGRRAGETGRGPGQVWGKGAAIISPGEGPPAPSWAPRASPASLLSCPGLWGHRLVQLRANSRSDNAQRLPVRHDPGPCGPRGGGRVCGGGQEPQNWGQHLVLHATPQGRRQARAASSPGGGAGRSLSCGGESLVVLWA